MKACPTCGRLYPADAGFCPVDGAALTSATQVPVASDDKDPRVGQMLLERYEIRRVVADGGMGRVYEALDMVERRNVAVKVLHREVAADPVSLERFRREFEVNKLLPHDHIVEVMDFCELPDGSSALVMEYLFGEELRQTLDREKFVPPGRIVRLISQVAVGLDKAHAQKLVHRDLKPDNVFLCQTPGGDIVKLLDFGSVKDKSEGSKKLTVMGTTIGSPYYMSPEQAQGLDTLDHRADIWALGAIVFECMAGRVPFQGINGPQILLSILSKEAPAVSSIDNPRFPIPPLMDGVLAKAFKKTASLRYDTVGDLADAIGHAYGLEGSHLQWAEQPEGELSKLIDGRFDSIMTKAPLTGEPRSAQDSFFGEGDSLGEGEDAMSRAMKNANAALKDAPLPALPTSHRRVPVWIYVAVGLVLVGLISFLTF